MTTSSRRVLLRTGSLVATTALVAAGFSSALVASGPSASAATVTTGDRLAGRSADWLGGQLTNGLLHNDQYDFDDVGLSIDTAFALREVGGHAAAVRAVRDAVAGNLDGYVNGDPFGDADSIYAGPTAKAVVLAQETGADPRSYGGKDLVADVEQVTADSGAQAGRISDVSTYGDNANVVGQAYAARALTAAGSSEAGSATTFLLQQQCASGFFRLSFSAPDAADQACDETAASGSAPDTDATAIAVLQLQQLDAPSPAVTQAITRATAWLDGHQRPDGSFGGGTTTEKPNANSTGLAGWALGETGTPAYVADARQAAGWVHRQQLQDVGACDLYRPRDVAAIAYDAAGLRSVQGGRIDEATQDQFRRATAQALPVLQWAAPHRAAKLSYPKVVRPGRTVTFRGRVTYGDATCLQLGGRHVMQLVGPNGLQRGIKAPTRPGRYPASLVVSGGGALRHDVVVRRAG